MADVVYDTLRPFHLWAQIAAVCAVLLALAAVAVLACSRRLSRRWWLGMGILTRCLLTVAFGERSRSAAGDLRPIAVCYSQGVSGCETWTSWLVEARNRLPILGTMAVGATILSLVVAAAVLFVERRRSAGQGWRPTTSAVTLAWAVPLSGFGAYLMADGVAAWIEYAYLSDPVRAGDGLGQIPLFTGILGTIVGALVLVVGAALVVEATPRRPRPL